MIGLGDPVFGGVYRDGNLLVVTRYGTLPPNCVKCGKPVASKPSHRKYSWRPFFIYFFFWAKFGIPLGDKIYELTTRFGGGEELELEVYICPKHQTSEILIVIAKLFLSAIGLSVFILGVGANNYLIWTGLLLIAISNIWAPMLRPTFIDESHGTFKGAGAAFLDQLEPKPLVVINTLGLR